MSRERAPRLIQVTLICHTSASQRELRRSPLLDLRLFETVDHEGEGKKIHVMEVREVSLLKTPTEKAEKKSRRAHGSSPDAGRTDEDPPAP